MIFFRRNSSLQRHLPKCEELFRNNYPRSVYQLRETLFDKLKAFDIEVTEDKLHITNVAVFDFESICVKNSTIADTETTTWDDKHEPISVSVTSTLLEQPIFICDTEPQSLVFSFVISLKNLARKTTLEMGLKFTNIGTTIKEKLERITSTLNKRRRTFSPTFHIDRDSAFDNEDEEVEEKDASTQFLSSHSINLFELQQHFERYANALTVFGFNSAKYDLNLIKSYPIPLIVNGKKSN